MNGCRFHDHHLELVRDRISFSLWTNLTLLMYNYTSEMYVQNLKGLYGITFELVLILEKIVRGSFGCSVYKPCEKDL